MTDPSPNTSWQQKIADKWQAAKALNTQMPSAEQVDAITDLMDNKVKATGQTLRSEMQQTLEHSGEKLEELSAILDLKIQTLGLTLRTEVETTMSQYRLEMKQIYEQQHEALKRQALYQWLVVIAMILGLLLKQFSSF